MDITTTAKAYRRRAEAREAERAERYRVLRGLAERAAVEIRNTFGPDIRVYLFGSLSALERFRGHSDIDLAVEGLSPSEYWEAWQLLETTLEGVKVDLVRLETASDSLRTCVRDEGELLE